MVSTLEFSIDRLAPSYRPSTPISKQRPVRQEALGSKRVSRKGSSLGFSHVA